MITEVPGVRVGHWTDERAATGCTVVLFPAGTVASGEVRGGAPATREWALLEPHRLVARLDAVVLTGGSAFGLAACDGVMQFCEERGMGFATSAGVVPIVVGAALFDLARGDPRARPGPAEGRAACEAASDGPVEEGSVGAGTGATVGKLFGIERAMKGGHLDVAVADTVEALRLVQEAAGNGSARSVGSFSSNTAWRSTALVLLLLVCTTPGGMIAIEYFGRRYVRSP